LFYFHFQLDFTCETWSMNKPKVLDMIRNMVEAKINSKPNGNIPEQEQVGERQDRTVQELKNRSVPNSLETFHWKNFL
jgi:hypothetical protein